MRGPGAVVASSAPRRAGMRRSSLPDALLAGRPLHERWRVRLTDSWSPSWTPRNAACSDAAVRSRWGPPPPQPLRERLLDGHCWRRSSSSRPGRVRPLARMHSTVSQGDEEEVKSVSSAIEICATLHVHLPALTEFGYGREPRVGGSSQRSAPAGGLVMGRWSAKWPLQSIGAQVE